MTLAKLALVKPDHRASTKPNLATVEGRLVAYCDGLTRRELAPRTIYKYAEEVQNGEWWCQQRGYSLRNVPAVVLGEYVATRPKSFATRNAMRAAFTHYWRIFKRKDPPIWMVKVPRKPKMVCRALTDEEAMRLETRARERGGREGFAVLLAMYQGLRREEISAVAWHDFGGDGWLKMLGKGDVPATLPLHPVVIAAAAELPRAHPTWVFPGRDGERHANPATIWSWVLLVAREAGLERVTPHRLRHTCLATANDNTGDLRAVQDFARHAKVDTSAGYTRTTARRLVAVMEAVNYGADAAEAAERERRLTAKLKRLRPEQVPVVEAVLDELLESGRIVAGEA
ncbi:MAG: tyrosine-type recombinase/integrase [Actinomycetota bacterium]|nr:tyrosine-type recombinase/integrase [Actinomycetota bacterium]